MTNFFNCHWNCNGAQQIPNTIRSLSFESDVLVQGCLTLGEQGRHFPVLREALADGCDGCVSRDSPVPPCVPLRCWGFLCLGTQWAIGVQPVGCSKVSCRCTNSRNCLAGGVVCAAFSYGFLGVRIECSSCCLAGVFDGYLVGFRLPWAGMGCLSSFLHKIVKEFTVVAAI